MISYIFSNFVVELYKLKMKERLKKKFQRLAESIKAKNKKASQKGFFVRPTSLSEQMRQEVYDAYNDSLWAMLEAEDFVEKVSILDRDAIVETQNYLDDCYSNIAVINEKFEDYKEFRLKLATLGNEKDRTVIPNQKFKNFRSFSNLLKDIIEEKLDRKEIEYKSVSNLLKTTDDCLKQINKFQNNYYEFVEDLFTTSKARRGEKVRSHYDLVYNAILDDIPSVVDHLESKILEKGDILTNPLPKFQSVKQFDRGVIIGCCETGKTKFFTELQQFLLSTSDKVTLEILKDGHRDACKIASEIEERSLSGNAIDDLLYRMALYDKLERWKDHTVDENDRAPGRPPANMFDNFKNHEQFDIDVRKVLIRAEADIFSNFKRKLKVSNSMLALVILEKFCNKIEDCYGQIANFYNKVIKHTKTFSKNNKVYESIVKEYRHKVRDYEMLKDSDKKNRLYELVSKAAAAFIAPLSFYLSL